MHYLLLFISAIIHIIIYFLSQWPFTKCIPFIYKLDPFINAEYSTWIYLLEVAGMYLNVFEKTFIGLKYFDMNYNIIQFRAVLKMFENVKKKKKKGKCQHMFR